jgi:small subunit ribosomal protein S9
MADEENQTPDEQEPTEQPAGDAEGGEPAGEPEESASEPEESAGEDEESAVEDEEAAPEPEQPSAEAADAAPKEEKKEGDLPPGAELEPIAIDAEREMSAEERARVEAEAEERARLEAEATAEGPEEPTARRTPIELEPETVYKATGKRKSSIARVRVTAGSGAFEVNKRDIDEYFPRAAHQAMARQPLVTTGFEGSVDVRVRVHGGGISGQAGAVRHGVARALTEVDSELRGELKRRGLLTRDARSKERRKAGLKKARKRPQFSKR